MNEGGRDHGQGAAPRTVPPVDEQVLAARLDSLATLAAHAAGADAAVIAVLDGEQWHAIGHSGCLRGEFPPGDPLLAAAFAHPEGLDLFDGHAVVLAAETLLETPAAPFRSGFALPIAEPGLRGVVCVLDRTAREQPLGQGPRELLATVATAVAGLFENRRHLRAERAVAASRATIAELEQRFAVLADAIPQLVWSSRADGHSDYFNRIWCEYTGAEAAASYGSGWLDFVHPEDRERATTAWSTAVENDSEYSIEYRLRRHDGVWRWMLARGEPLRDGAGGIIRWLGTCTDVHETRAAAQQNELLSRELSHRIKNIFAVIGGLIGLTIRQQPAYAGVGRELMDRVLALGRAHDFVRPQSAASRRALPHTSLFGMLQELFAAYDGHAEQPRIALAGDDVAIDDRSATPLALAFHELATNAIKYGALSQPGGRVELTVRDAGATVSFTWAEHGGPPVSGAPNPGFGSSLIDLSLRLQLGGEVRQEWAHDGLRVTATIPAAAMARA